MTAFEIRPTAGSLGAEIHGLDLRNPLDPATAAEIERVLVKVIMRIDQPGNDGVPFCIDHLCPVGS